MAANFLGKVLLNVQPFLQATQQARKEWGNFNEDLSNTQAVARGAAISLGVLGGVVINAFRESLNVFTEFEQGLKNAEIAIGLGSDAMEDLREAAIEMGNRTQITASTATIALGEMAKAGFDAADSIDAAWGAVSLAIATQGDLQTSSKLIASTIRQFTLEASEAARVADIFINAIFNSPATLESLAAAMKYAGPIARQYGATLTETVIGLELLLDTGLRGEQAGTALRNMFIRLVNPTAKTAAIIDKMGLTLESVNPQIVGMYNAVQTLAENNLSAADATSIFGVRAINAYLTISRAVQNPSVRLDELREKMEQTGTALGAQEAQLDTFRGSWTLLTSALETVQVRVGDIIQRLLRPMVDALRSLVNAFNYAPAAIQGTLIVLTGLVGVSTTLVGALILVGSRMKDIQVGVGFAITAIGNFNRTIIASTRGIIAWGAAMLGAMSRSLILSTANAFATFGMALSRLSPALHGAVSAVLTFTGAFQILARLLQRIPLLFFIVEFFIALRNNAHALTEVFDGLSSVLGTLWNAIGSLLDALFSTDSIIGRLVRTVLGIEGSFVKTNPIVAAFGQIIKGISGLVVIFSGALEGAIATVALLGNIITKGPVAAFREYDAELERIENQMWNRLENIFDPDPIDNFVNSAKSLGPVVDDINAMYASFGEFSDQTQDLNVLAAQLEALHKLRDKYADNADALSLINAEITKLTDKGEVLEGNLADAAREAERLVDAMRGELEGLQISLIPDDETRKIAEAQQRYREWYEELAQQQEVNPFLRTPEVDALIAQRQELLQQEISQIMADAEEKRLRDARDNLDKLLALHERAEKRIRDLRLAMAGDGRARLRMEYDEALIEHEKFYENYIAELREAGEDIEAAMERQRAERKLLDVQYIEDVLSLYRDFYTELHDAQSQLDSSAVNVGAMTETARLQRELERQQRAIRLHYDERRRQMAGDEAAITRLMQQEAAARELAQLEYLKAVSDAHEEYANRRAELQRSMQGDIVRMSGSESQRALFDFLGDVNDTIAAYEDLANEARKYGKDVQSVYDDLHAALLVKEAAFQQEMTRINQEASRERLRQAIETASESLRSTSVAQLRALEAQLDLLRDAFSGDSEALKAIDSFNARVTSAISTAVSTQASQLNASLDGMSRATLSHLLKQVEAWRWAYGDNGEALKAIDGSITNILTRIQKLDEDFQAAVDGIIASASRFSQSVAKDLMELNLSEADRELMSYLGRAGEAARLMGELRALLPEATEAQAAAIMSSLGSLASSIEDAARLGVEVAERLARDAVEAYNRGLVDAVSSASDAGVGAITGLVSDSLSRVFNANALGLAEARTELRRLLTELSIAGFDSASLDPIREYIREVDGLLSQHAVSLADFASGQFREIRQVASAVLEESEARRVSLRTLEDEISLRQEALDVTERLARDGAMSTQDVLRARQNLVSVQLEYVKGLNDERDALRDNFNAVVDYADVIEKRLGLEGVETLEAMRDVLINQVIAMQEAGAAYEEYSAMLAQAEGINERVANLLSAANERALETVSELAERQQEQASALETLRVANRRHIEMQLESVDVGRRQTQMYRQLITAMRSGIEASEQEAGALERLVRERRELGDVSGAINSQKALVDITNARAESIENEINALEERAEAMRALILDNENARKSLRDLISSITSAGGFDLLGLREGEGRFDADRAVSDRGRLIRQLQQENLTLEEQMEILKEVEGLTERIAEANRQSTILGRDRLGGQIGPWEESALNEIQARIEREMDEQNRAAEEQVRLAEEAARQLREALVETLSDLSVAINDLNSMLSKLFETVSRDSTFDSIYENLIGDTSRFPQEMAELIDAIGQLGDEAAIAGRSLAQALDIQSYAADGKATVEELVEALRVYGEADFSGLGGVSGAAFREAFDAEARALVDNLVMELGGARLDEAIRAWQAASGLPQVGLEIGKPIGEGAAIALMAALRDGYDPSDFLDYLNEQNQRVSDRVSESAAELGAEAGRAASRAFMTSMIISSGEPGVDVAAFMRTALPTESIIDEGLRVGSDVLDGVLSGVSSGNESWRGVGQEFSQALSENLMDPAEDMGREAGIGFVGAMITGIMSQKDALVNAVRNLLSSISDYLPHSDAKKGPLSTLTQSGRAFTRTFGQGALSQKGWLESRVGAALGAALPSVAPGAYASPVSASVAPGAAGGPVVVNVDGRSQAAPGPAAMNARRLVADVERELRLRGYRRR